ncbi:Carbonic anhydrase, beta class [hydrothermal vent metagenome]|uniref:carbonic anhydrase n=1 Tax=hydrothermal vent metagenome TaxID=652676 RepID=A0A3B0RDR2_9ZZZZ
MDSYAKLLNGYAKFRDQYLAKENDTWRDWAKDGQNPKVMFIACSDSRVNPVILTHSGLGEIFIVNNVANLVPPYKKDDETYHGTSAAIEFAVTQLKVEHIIIMGHSGCGGIRALITNHDTDKDPEANFSFIRPWMKIVDEAAEFTVAEKENSSIEALAATCERRASLISLNNLMGFPWVHDALLAETLQVHAWHFDIGSGTIEAYNTDTEQFEDLV